MIGLTANLEQLGLFPRQPERMRGDFRIAVAGFSAADSITSSESGIDLAESVAMRLQAEFSEARQDFTVTIWGPERVGQVKGNSSEERISSAARIGDLLGADMVLYGTIITQNDVTYVVPEFHLSTNRFYEAGEITGSHEFGQQIPILSKGSVSDRIETGSALAHRIHVLSRVAIGLSYYSVRGYLEALGHFRAAESALRSEDESVRRLLLVLIGNAAMRGGDLALAEEQYSRALRIDNRYARAYLGMGDVYYLKAQSGFRQTQNPKDIDTEMLDAAVAFYKEAFTAEDQPILAEVPAKVHYGLGQASLLRTYSGTDDTFDDAIREFEAIIAEFEETGNPRLRRLAAESHARLGLIFELAGQGQRAVSQYRVASSLVDDDSDRSAHFADRAQRIEDGETDEVH